MYIPKANAETRLPVLRQMMNDHPLAAVVTLGASGLIASHIPLVYEDDGSEFGLLKGHVSRANTQWKDLSPDVETLAIFAGAQHYVSAGWYPGKHEHGKEVPTWNYVVVHAYGTLRIVQDPAWLMAHLASLTDQHEAASPIPWKVQDAPANFIAALCNGIIGFELPIRRLEGKWKVSQNRSERDRHAVITGLQSLDTPESRTMGDLVASFLAKEQS